MPPNSRNNHFAIIVLTDLRLKLHEDAHEPVSKTKDETTVLINAVINFMRRRVALVHVHIVHPDLVAIFGIRSDGAVSDIEP